MGAALRPLARQEGDRLPRARADRCEENDHPQKQGQVLPAQQRPHGEDGVLPAEAGHGPDVEGGEHGVRVAEGEHPRHAAAAVFQHPGVAFYAVVLDDL